MKYKTGDKVRIKPFQMWLTVPSQYYGVIVILGNRFRIHILYCEFWAYEIILDGNTYYLHTDDFELVEEKEKSE